jgi:uncharacterized membrane protein
MRTIKLLFTLHLLALLFGLAGLLIALPHPELWSSSPLLVSIFSFGIKYAGSLHILFGAATVLLFGLLCFGARRTLIFFAAATLISLSMELIGTSTGFPFGPYAYNDFLGFKILGHVPYSIPLSWFYMGFTAYLLAHLLLEGRRLAQRSLWTLLLGAYLLTVWDLTLDPAMASERLMIHFWQWGVRGAYFGMPVQNLVGWSLTGLLYMSVARFFWRSDLETRQTKAWLPFGIYTANTLFAIALDVSVGLWQPPLLGLLLGIAPATLVLFRRGPGASFLSPPLVGALLQRITRMIMRSGSCLLLRGRVRVTVEGGEQLPARGAVLIAARHYHHLYDGCALLCALKRPVHILVALDWAGRKSQRRLMETLCALAGWPVILRAEQLGPAAAAGASKSAYRPEEVALYLRRAVRQVLALLKSGKLVVVFPEGYPLVDPRPSPRRAAQTLLPFRPGFARLVELAGRETGTSVPVVPAGIVWRDRSGGGPAQLTLRFGAPLFRQSYGDTAQFIAAVEERVRTLSEIGESSPDGRDVALHKEVLRS